MNLNAYSGKPRATTCASGADAGGADAGGAGPGGAGPGGAGPGDAGPGGAGPDDHSGTTLDGTPVSDLEVVDLVRATGSLTIVRGPAQRLRRSAWVEQIGILMDSLDLHTSIHDSGRLVVIVDLDRSGWAPSAPEAERDEPASRAAHPSGWARPRVLPDLPT